MSSVNWDNRHIHTIGDVAFALKCLGLPRPTQDALVYLASGPEKTRFHSTLTRATSHSADPQELTYLSGIANCISSETFESLRALNLEPSPNIMVSIGISNGEAFHRALQAATNPPSPRQEAGLNYINNLLQATVSAHRERDPSTVAVGASRSSDILPDEAAGPNQSGAKFRSVHVYGASAALCFNATQSKDRRHYTIIVDATCTRKGGKDGDWDWSTDVIKIHLGYKELPDLYNVLFGWVLQASFTAHGANHDKAFEIQRQEGKFFAKVVQKGKGVRAVPITSSDATPLIMLVFNQMLLNAPGSLRSSPELFHQMLRSTQVIHADVSQ